MGIALLYPRGAGRAKKGFCKKDRGSRDIRVKICRAEMASRFVQSALTNLFARTFGRLSRHRLDPDGSEIDAHGTEKAQIAQYRISPATKVPRGQRAKS
jgi:hypothetical protein